MENETLTNRDSEQLAEIKSSVENFLSEISKTGRSLFSYEEVENMLLDIYNLIKQ